MQKEKDTSLLNVKELYVTFSSDEGLVYAVNGVSLNVIPGEPIGIVGESGCGKSVTARAILRILAVGGEITSGEVWFNDKERGWVDLTKFKADSPEMRSIRGKQIGMIFQEPMTSLSPVHTIFRQVSESMMYHLHMDKNAAREKTISLLEKVGIPNASQRLNDYPFQFSGGMRQRVMIAMALSCNPQIVIADEPTTALDVSVQAQVLQLIRDMQTEYNLSLVLITHDLGVIAHMVDYVYVLYLGQVVESGPVMDMFDSPKHPYTIDLLKSVPRLTGKREKHISSIKGSVPTSYALPKGCPFYSRCSRQVGPVCKESFPSSTIVGTDHKVSCFLYTKEVRKSNVET